jgi:hypothetical protein
MPAQQVRHHVRARSANARNSFNVDVSAGACVPVISACSICCDGQVIAGPAPGPPVQLKVEVRGDKVFVSR